MALSTKEIHALVGEVRRVLRPGGVFVYTVRHTGDAHYGAGTGHGDDIWERGGFAVPEDVDLQERRDAAQNHETFHCVACGHSAHADTVGALNVLRAGLVRREAQPA
ncbi:zinc ribbon domain-containing protein [Streptomyces sp. NPDC056227]|uniref:zinc ribbon domain-containing protein n=1 Tax=Streptomyces sp. NPDC056227 TaxID=3345753 RepID=UPI0035DB2725